mmetsp:Transcript_90626/g.270422  ORF Transcript_90626/g.270422 Transcript_90626/m.270422 type:complete len:297 (-) Transcript_90626:106-996(-)
MPHCCRSEGRGGADGGCPLARADLSAEGHRRHRHRQLPSHLQHGAEGHGTNRLQLPLPGEWPPKHGSQLRPPCLWLCQGFHAGPSGFVWCSRCFSASRPLRFQERGDRAGILGSDQRAPGKPHRGHLPPQGGARWGAAPTLLRRLREWQGPPAGERESRDAGARGRGGWQGEGGTAQRRAGGVPEGLQLRQDSGGAGAAARGPGLLCDPVLRLRRAPPHSPGRGSEEPHPRPAARRLRGRLPRGHKATAALPAAHPHRRRLLWQPARPRPGRAEPRAREVRVAPGVPAAGGSAGAV